LLTPFSHAGQLDGRLKAKVRLSSSADRKLTFGYRQMSAILDFCAGFLQL
jgi:hypothetical protein